MLNELKYYIAVQHLTRLLQAGLIDETQIKGIDALLVSEYGPRCGYEQYAKCI